MRRTLVFALLALAAVPTSAQATTAASDAAQVRNLILRQSTLHKQSRFRALYRLYTPRYRARCPYARWVQGQRISQRRNGTSWRVRNIRVVVRGARASARYRIVAGGEVVYETRRPDLYVKINGVWRDELDSETTC
jgi:hypothetical protein